MLDIKFEKGRIYFLEEEDGERFLFLMNDEITEDRLIVSITPLANDKNLKWKSLFLVLDISNIKINNALIKEVFREDLPLYVGWPHVSSKLLQLIGEVSHG